MFPWIVALSALALAPAIGDAGEDAAPPSQIALAQPFATRSPWRLVVSQGTPTEDYGGNPAPGAISLCLSKGSNAPCDPEAVTPPRPKGGEASADWDAHYLLAAKPVYPRGPAERPLLELVTASLHAGDSGQIRVTQLVRYDRPSDRFQRVYAHLTGTNNNQEVRFIDSGPLRGEVVSAEPTSNAPYGYWIEVSRLEHGRAYRRVLRYRSTTRYDDGNSLAVIDSEMVQIERRLHVLPAGGALPLPTSTPCPRPGLRNKALWCT